MHLNDFDGTQFGDLDTLSIQNRVLSMKFMLLYKQKPSQLYYMLEQLEHFNGVSQ